MLRPAALPTLLAALALAGCATPRADHAGDPIGSAVEQPLRDLSLIRDEVPPVLLGAASAPYEPPADCDEVLTQLKALDAVLGPDLGQPVKTDGAAGLAGDLVRGVASLPFRGVVRRMTGAHQRDEALRAAIVGGVARRGFLNGYRRTLRCEAAPETASR